jgi:hypothetical protein
MADQRPWIDLDSAILPLASRVSPTEAGFVGEVVDRRGQLVWASDPQVDESAADWLAASQKKAYEGIRRLRALRSQR